MGWSQASETADTDRIARALSGQDGEDQQRLARTGVEWIALMLRKNKDYGSSVWKVPRLAPKLSPGDAILVRASDKVGRIESLAGRTGEVADESFDDTLRDLAAYCLLYLARPMPSTKQETAANVSREAMVLEVTRLIREGADDRDVLDRLGRYIDRERL